MLKLLLPLSLLAIYASNATADVLVYRFTERGQIIGGSESPNASWRGYWLIDSGTGETRSIAYTSNVLYGENQSRKWYDVRGHGNMLFTQASGNHGSISILGLGTTANEFSDSTTVWVGNIYLSGRNKTLVTGVSKTVFAPQTLVGKIHVTGHIGRNGGLATEETSLVLVYDRSKTVSYNEAGMDVSSAQNSITTDLEQQGYQHH